MPSKHRCVCKTQSVGVVGSNPAPLMRLVQLVEHYTANVEEEVHRFSKNGEENKGQDY
jgi:hypothetical protein